jgi:uncharacterized protein (DUF1015 family)
MSKEPVTKLDDSNDFGFSHVDESEVNLGKVNDTTALSQKWQNNLKNVIAEVFTFLDKLKDNPDKEFIKWPNRVADIEKFKTKLNNLSNR